LDSQFASYGSGGMSSFDPIAQLNFVNDSSLLSSTLPLEAQQMVGGGFDSMNTNAYMPYFMNQSQGTPVPQHGVNYSYNPNLSSLKTTRNTPSSIAMNQTLSQGPLASVPTTLDTKLDQIALPTYSPPTASTSEVQTPYSQNFNFPNYGLVGDMTKSTEGTHTTGTPTNEYDSLLNFNDEQELA